MDRDGVHAQVVYGPVGGFAIEDLALKLVAMRAYNDWASEFNRTAPDRLLVLAQIPAWDPAIAAEELARAAGLGHRGAQLGVREAGMALFEGGWEPFWDAAEGLALPVSFHLGGGMQLIWTRPHSWSRIATAAVSPMQLDEALAGVLASGLCERHPGLRLVIGESGLGWAPYVLERLDREYRKYDPVTEDYRLRALPSETFRRQVYLTYEEDSIGLRLLPEIGAGNVMWASDYPHGDSTWPESRKAVAETLAALSPEDGRRVVSHNAAELYGIA
jgi:predicted TIM-barrel fold metal-dependent hydrolase